MGAKAHVTLAPQRLFVSVVTVQEIKKMFSFSKTSAWISVLPSQCPLLPKYVLIVKVHVILASTCLISASRVMMACLYTDTCVLQSVPTITIRTMTRWSVKASHRWIYHSRLRLWQVCAQYSY